MGVQPLTTHQQLERLIELGIKSSPRNIQKDEEALETIGYYKLKEFAMPFNYFYLIHYNHLKYYIRKTIKKHTQKCIFFYRWQQNGNTHVITPCIA